MGQKILIVEDEADIQELLRFNLMKAGFELSCVDSGEEAIPEMRNYQPDLVLLDLMLPGISGLEVCRLVRNDPHLSQTPIIIVSARGEEHDIVTGLDMGAEDYIVKPFSLKILQARVRRLLNRHAPSKENDRMLTHLGLEMDLNRHEVRSEGKKLDLTSSEFSLLKVLMERPGWVFTRNQIVRAVHGDDYPVTNRSVDVMVLGLRRKLGEAGSFIETVRGVGYRFAE